MKIAIACHHYPVASGRYVADAFRRLGHEVETIGDTTSNRIWGITVDEKYMWFPSTSINISDAAWPDIVIVLDSDPAIWDQVNQVPFSCPVIVYGVDNHVRSYEYDLFDHYFLSHCHGQAYPVDPARKDHTWLPCAYDPTVFTPSPIAWEDREYDVAMVGVMYPRRAEIIEAMRAAGLKVFAATGLLYEEYRNAYWNARISLCVSAAGDIAQRVFETAAMGCAILTDPLADLMDEVTNHVLGLSGYAVYWSTQEAVAIAKSMLAGDYALMLTQNSVDRIPPLETARAVHSIGTGSAEAMMKSVQPHTWDARAKVIVDWYEREYGNKYTINTDGWQSDGGLQTTKYFNARIREADIVETLEPTPSRKAYLNLGCGTTHFPGERPPGHELIDEAIYAYPHWLNVDKVGDVGADKVFDLFAYPWPLEDNSFDGAVLGHIAEHIPHEIKARDFREDDPNTIDSTSKRCTKLLELQDGWYAFFSELYRVLTPGALVHVISPYGWSDGAITDPTHTRLLTANTFHHGLRPEQYSGTFKYNIDCNFVVDGQPVFRFTEMAKPFQNDQDQLMNAVMTRLNMVYDFYIRLKAVK